MGDMACSLSTLHGALGPVATALLSSRGPAGSERLTLGALVRGGTVALALGTRLSSLQTALLVASALLGT